MKNKLERYAYNINSNYVIQEGKELYNNSKGNWYKIFNNKNPLVLELACGNGEYTVERSIIDPEKNFIGLDIKGARIWKGAKELEKYKSKNAFFLRTQIENIIDFFKKDEVEEIIISFPDPRPKKRDIKKRLTNLNFLKLYYEILNKNGRLILKTDDDNLFNFSIDEIKSSKFILNDYTKDLHSSSKFDLYKSVKTKYEKKFLLQGKKIKLLECLK
ncbi:MAG: tRNA (guanine-N(7)-)-methyltransferase [Flammeovirgaceae bacterium]|nr:MAG: tRNA (guanine-N(7)-)-methyltransferase [Flammeovirgaceae bacterium]